ncbi:nuclear transport factor 2 family protein [Pseudooceanicola aestuarii]|uniref:nuclear transport factor 2 family protein n=1 Tax=Pseudooceanicola aestuarii TaxID=2697319 RepID=UPI0013D53889|nr:nuclear transport factor 2 family protein [Pseudooceanicola aestuarii]
MTTDNAAADATAIGAPVTLHAAALRSLEIWHQAVAAKDMSRLAEITHPDAEFRSPVAFNAYHSAEALHLALSTVMEVFDDFTYHREAVATDGHSVVLEFSATVTGKGVRGIDFIKFDAEGRITEFEVMMRPLNGVQALAAEMGRRLGATLPSFKA